VTAMVTAMATVTRTAAWKTAASRMKTRVSNAR
jgi:hypothetical protein